MLYTMTLLVPIGHPVRPKSRDLSTSYFYRCQLCKYLLRDDSTQFNLLQMAVRRSARLGLPCSRKCARLSDLSPEQPLSTPRSVRAQKRQKILDGSFTTPNIDNGNIRTGKRKTLVPDVEQHHYDSDNHNRVVKKKRKENIVNDALVVTPTWLEITMNLDTRKGGGNNVC